MRQTKAATIQQCEVCGDRIPAGTLRQCDDCRNLRTCEGYPLAVGTLVRVTSAIGRETFAWDATITAVNLAHGSRQPYYMVTGGDHPYWHRSVRPR